jgi:hypothetical protein
MGLAVTLAANLRRDAVEYRALASLSGLEPGADVTLAGQAIGRVVAVKRHGDTTALRVRFNRGAERLPGSRTVCLRVMGLDQRIVLEMHADPPTVRAKFSRSFAIGGWLEVLSSDVPKDAFGDPVGRRQATPPPAPVDLMPNARSIPSPAPLART